VDCLNGLVGAAIHAASQDTVIRTVNSPGIAAAGKFGSLAKIGENYRERNTSVNFIIQKYFC
jgi:hypothetical protein